MTKMIVISVYDSKVKVFSQPMVVQNRGAALRAWQEASNDRNSNVGKYPEDHTLFEIGTWDDETGEVKMHEAKISLGTAIEFLRVDPRPTQLQTVSEQYHQQLQEEGNH